LVKRFSFSLAILIQTCLFTQSLEGYVFNAINKEALPHASLSIESLNQQINSDINGYFNFDSLPTGLYNLEIRYTGFNTKILHQIEISRHRDAYFDIYLDETASNLKMVEVSAPAFKKTAATPLSLINLPASEIQKFPGAVMDLTKVIKTYPGISPKTSFGYNIVFRGGASNENSFFLDDIEIPIINHFSVQGASGGPVSLINTDFIESMDIYTGAFPSEKGNTLSGILDIKQRDAHKEKLGATFTLGSTDVWLTLESPTGDNGNLIVSGRKSFSEYLFKGIGLPVLPNYTDFQYRHKYRWGKHELLLLALGAMDKSRLNWTDDPTESLLYNTGFIPEGDQNIWVTGMSYKHYLDSGYYQLVLSRNYFENIANKASIFNQNTLLDYKSIEAETKGRFEQLIYHRSFRIKYGLSGELHNFNLNNYSLLANRFGIDSIDIEGKIAFESYGLFASVAKDFFKEKIQASLGARMDGSNLNLQTKRLWSQFSPRLSLSYNISKHLSLNSSYGIYYQLPPYTVIGHIQDNSFVNKDKLGYIECEQKAIGLAYSNKKNYKISLEVFDKKYRNYPFLLEDSISLANLAADYVSLGYQAANSTGLGRAQGLEIMIQKKLHKSYFWMASYSYIISEFQDKYGNWTASSWDNRQFANIVFGKTFKRNMQLGLKWRYSGGTPYSPYDIHNSSKIEQWQISNRGIFNYDALNSLRLPSFHQMDIRIDKHYYFKKYNLNLFLDIQNLYRSPIAFLPYLTVERDAQMLPIEDPSKPGHYLTKVIDSDSGRMLPTLGLILKF